MERNIRLLIVDSNEDLRMELWKMFILLRSFHLVAEVSTVGEAMEYLRNHEVDVVFANHQPAAPHLTSQGPYLSILLRKDHPDIQVVTYGTSTDDAYQACRYQCAGYLMLPFDPLDFHGLMDHIIYIYDLQQAKRAAENHSVMLRTRTGYQMVRLQEILFLEYVRRSSWIITGNGQKTELLGYTMSDLEKMLERHGFFRCYQSYIVNLSKVAAVRVDTEEKRYAIRFEGYEGEVPISRKKYAEIVSRLHEKSVEISD